MKKTKKLGKLGVLAMTAVMASYGSIGLIPAKAVSSTASEKGFSNDGLTYCSDLDTPDVVLKGTKYTYGTFSMWSACYKYIVTETDGTQTCYYYALIESSISSVGKSNGDFFRNEDLNIDVYFKAYDNDSNYKLVTFVQSRRNQRRRLASGIRVVVIFL